MEIYTQISLFVWDAEKVVVIGRAGTRMVEAVLSRTKKARGSEADRDETFDHIFHHPRDNRLMADGNLIQQVTQKSLLLTRIYYTALPVN